MTNEDDMTIRQAAREICATQAAQHAPKRADEAFYLAGVYDNQLAMRLVEQGIRKGVEIGRSL